VEMSSLPPNSEAHRGEPSSSDKPGPDGKDLPEEAVKSEAEAPDEREKTVVPFLSAKTVGDNAKTGGDNATTGGDEKISADKAPADAGKAPEIKLGAGEGAAAKAPEPVVKQDPPMGRPIGSALVPFVPKSAGAEETRTTGAEPPRKKVLQSRAMQAAVLAAFVGLGWAAAGSFMGSHTTKPAPQQRTAAAVASPAASETGGETKKLTDDVKALRKEVETLRAALARNGNGDEIRSLKRSVESVKDNMESTRSDVASLSGKVDKIQHDPGKLREINDRLEHIERQGPATTASIAPPAEPPAPKPSAQVPLPPTKTIAAKPETAAKEAPAKETPARETVAKAETPAPAAPRPPTAANADKPQLLTNWVVRDVYRGIALVEGPRGSVEVGPGETIPGAGTVKSIERRGNGWIVVTSRGLVDSARN